MPESTQEQYTTTPLISVITIVYNDIAHIAQTMDSVVGQSYEKLEYIIIDGASSDGTKERILGYIKDCAEITRQESSKQECSDRESSAVDSGARFYLEATHKTKNLTFKFLSERDSGIYDAMNKGIDLATGEWCNFMNCGDRFYASSTIEELFREFFESLKINRANKDLNKETSMPSAVYGDTLATYDTHSKIPKAKGDPSYRMPFCHQSVFVKTALLKQYHFDTSFKFHADGDFFTKIYNQGERFFAAAMIVSVFNVDGISSKPSWQMFIEESRIISRVSRLRVIPLALHYLAKYLVQTLLPQKLYLKLASIYNAKS